MFAKIEIKTVQRKILNQTKPDHRKICKLILILSVVACSISFVIIGPMHQRRSKLIHDQPVLDQSNY